MGANAPSVADHVDRERAARDVAGSHGRAVDVPDRAGGNLSRPYFPDGNIGSGPGPFLDAHDRFRALLFDFLDGC